MPLFAKQKLEKFVCTHCIVLLQQAGKVRCLQCGLGLGLRPQAFGWSHCRHCRPTIQQQAQDTLSTIVCCDYMAPFDQWITQLKYGSAHGLAHFLGFWLSCRILQSNTLLPDLLIPVPCSREKMKQRGYNQAALIAKHVGHFIKRPVELNWLSKADVASAQADLGRADRLRNLEGAFHATRPISPRLRIGLVDDVFTTGATLRSCEMALRKAGAKSIVFMAICRTPE